MKRRLIALFALTMLFGFSMVTEAADTKPADRKAGADKAENVPPKCKKAHSTMTALKEPTGKAIKAYRDCKKKYQKTHLVRCRKEKAAMRTQMTAMTKARDNFKVCAEGCSWLEKRAKRFQERYKACRKKNKWTGAVRCRSLNNKAKAYAKQFASCKRFRK